MQRLILSSTSPCRKALLERLQLSFETAPPDVDETPRPDESPATLAVRLAEAKAKAVASQFPDALIIGADEVGCLDSEIINKPENHDEAVSQLRRFSGRKIVFLTGVCVLNTATNSIQTHIEPFEVTFRPLTLSLIEKYLQREQPYQCTGSLKAEGLGIALLQEFNGADPTTLLGLPMIQLIRMLTKEGVEII